MKPEIKLLQKSFPQTTTRVKRSEFNIIRFLILFVLLLEGFYLYVGMTSEGGRLFSPFLASYLNFPDWLSITVARFSKFLLEISGYSIYQKNPANITITGSRGVNLDWACLGVGPMSLWVAFVAAHRCVIKYKLKWIAAGIVLICVVNALRLIMIVLSYYYHWTFIRHFDAHTSFNIVTYIIILLLMYIFVRSYNRIKKDISVEMPLQVIRQPDSQK